MTRVHDVGSPPRCIVIAGPNGAGKTTFAREYLARDGQPIHFINADLIAAGLSPLAPERAALSAARVMLAEIDRLSAAYEDFAFESTLSGRAYVSRLKRLKTAGYRVEIVYLRVAPPRLLLKRIAARVRQGGHTVARADVLRRFTRSQQNFETVYRSLADAWAVYENSGVRPYSSHKGPDTMTKLKTAGSGSARNPQFAKDVGKALVRAAAAARQAAKRYGTPIYVWENGKVVAKRP